MVVLFLCGQRSGSSFYARSLFVMGAYFGQFLRIKNTVESTNARGVYENTLAYRIDKRLRDTIEPKKATLANKIYWKFMSFAKDHKWYRYHTFFDDPKWEFPGRMMVKDIDPITVAAMERLLIDLDKGGVGVIKQPDMVFTYPLWKGVLNSLGIKHKIIVVFRNPVSAAKSMVNFVEKGRRMVMSEKVYISRWTIINRLALKYVEEAVGEGTEVLWNDFDWPQDKMMQRLEANCERLGLKFDREKATGLFDPSQKHYNDNVYDSVRKLGDAEALKVYEELLRRSETVTGRNV